MTKPKKTPLEIKDCVFYGVRWDSQAIESVNTTAKALLNLTELFKSQNIHIECLLKVEQEKEMLGEK